MTQDIFGQDCSLTDPRAISEWNGAQLGVLAHAARTANLLGAVLEAAPDFSLSYFVWTR